MTEKSTTAPWYHKGLKFKCTECGKCCTGQPGYVWVTPDEIRRMAEFLGIPSKKFMRQYIRQKNNRYALVEKRSQNFDCILLQGKQCLVYKTRPMQCRTYPWWKRNLKSKESWAKTAEECEGINEEAPVVPCLEIEKNKTEHENNSDYSSSAPV